MVTVLIVDDEPQLLRALQINLRTHGREDKVEALDAGADDYVTKPSGLEELLARLRAAERRFVAAPETPVVTTDDFRLDIARRRAERQGEQVRLPPTEWKVVERLVRNSGQLLAQQKLLLEVWGYRFEP